jgi:integrase
MGRRQKNFPSYRQHHASGQAIVTIAGRDIYLGLYGSVASRAEYDRVISEWIAAGRPNEPVNSFAITVVELCLAFWEYAKQQYTIDGKLTGEVHPLKSVIKLLRTKYGPTRVSEFGPLSLKSLRDGMIELGWSRKTINQQINRIRRIFRWGVSEELVPPSVIQALDTVAGLRAGKSKAKELPPVEPVDDALVDATLNYLPPIVADMVRLQRLSGARPGEICTLRPSDIEQGEGVWLYRPGRHKTQHRGKSRIIAIGPRGQEILKPYLSRSPEQFCFSPMESEEKRRAERHEKRQTPLKYGNSPGKNLRAKPKRQPGTRYNVNSYRQAVHRACTAAKLKPWNPHQLRHTAATEIRKKFGLEAAQVTLGHATADVTQIYAERDLARAVEIMKQVG